MLCMKAVKRVNPKSSHHKIIFLFFLIFYLSEMMDVHPTYCGNNFMMYVSQIIMLHNLNAICQLYLNKTERKKVILMLPIESLLSIRGLVIIQVIAWILIEVHISSKKNHFLHESCLKILEMWQECKSLTN